MLIMRHLNEFNIFNWKKFAEGKRFLVTSCRPWLDFESQKTLGSAVEVVIYKDETEYKQKEGEQTTNLFEKLTFKVNKELDIPIKAFVEPVNVSAKIYGEYRNQLSVKCNDITVLRAQGKS